MFATIRYSRWRETPSGPALIVMFIPNMSFLLNHLKKKRRVKSSRFSVRAEINGRELFWSLPSSRCINPDTKCISQFASYLSSASRHHVLLFKIKIVTWSFRKATILRNEGALFLLLCRQICFQTLYLSFLISPNGDKYTETETIYCVAMARKDIECEITFS